MSQPDQRSGVKFTLWEVACLVAILCVCSALIPGSAMFIVGATPVAIGFIVFVIGDQRRSDWITILGAALMAVGLIIGGLLMALAQSLGQ
jgi:hypothetical protein